MRRVLVADTGNPSHVAGGQSAFLRTILPRLSDSVILCAPTHGREPLGRLGVLRLRSCEIGFFPICRVAHPRRRPIVPVRLRCAVGASRVRRLAQSAGCVWAHSIELAVVFSYILPNAPLLLHIHGAANPLAVSRYPLARVRYLQRVYEWAYRTAITRADRILSVDREGLELCERLVPGSSDRGEVMPNCFDSSLFYIGDRDAARKMIGAEPNAVVLVFTGRLETHKGTDVLLQALYALHNERGIAAHLYIAGEGTQLDGMVSQAKQLGLTDYCHFLGWADTDTLRGHLQAANALILPSHAEGTPTAVLESLACGTPVVCSDVGGLPDLVRTQVSGRLVAGHDPLDFAAAIEDVLTDEIEPSAVAESVKCYDVDVVAARIQEVLDEYA